MRTTDINEAKRRLIDGGLVAIPTETVYGLAAIASDEAAVRKVFELKARPFFDPLIVHIGEWRQLEQAVQGFSAVEEFLARRFWPGPLTVVTKKLAAVSDLITAGHETVAVRMPDHPLTLELLLLLGAPVVAPSANQFGRTSPTAPEHVESEFPNGEVLVLDGGRCELGIESTVVEVQDDTVWILRPGGVSRSEIKKALDESGLSLRVERRVSAQSPGHLKHHYQPSKPLLVTFVDLGLPEISKHLNKNVQKIEELNLSSDPAIAARILYAALRSADQSSAEAIVLKWIWPKEGLWEAIWDRVSKAASVVVEERQGLSNE